MIQLIFYMNPKGWEGAGLYSGETGVSLSSGYLVTACTKQDEFLHYIGRELSRCLRYDTAQTWPKWFLVTGIPRWTGAASGGLVSGVTGDSQSSGYLVTACTKRDEFLHYIGRELSRCSRYDPNIFLDGNSGMDGSGIWWSNIRWNWWYPVARLPRNHLY